jgi:hypothetical protein
MCARQFPFQRKTDPPTKEISIESGTGLRHGVYKLYERGDNYGCKNCNIKGDKYCMNVHNCRGTKVG